MMYKVAELEGALLDAAVAKAEGKNIEYQSRDYSPSTEWRYGGPLIERERISVCLPAVDSSHWMASIAHDFEPEIGTWNTYEADGPTLLIAAMRAYVASKLGAEVEL